MIETKRLRIIPLDSEQFALLLNGVHFMEDALRLTPSNETLDPHTRQAMTGQYQLSPADQLADHLEIRKQSHRLRLFQKPPRCGRQRRSRLRDICFLPEPRLYDRSSESLM